MNFVYAQTEKSEDPKICDVSDQVEKYMAFSLGWMLPKGYAKRIFEYFTLHTRWMGQAGHFMALNLESGIYHLATRIFI